MSVVQAFIERQIGLHNLICYDTVFKRLVVAQNDSYHGMMNPANQVVAEFNPEPPIFACRFAEARGYEHFIALANEDGAVGIQNTFSNAKSNAIEGMACHQNAVFDLAWMQNKMGFVTVSGDHTARLWDLRDGTSLNMVQTFCGHIKSIKTVTFRPEDSSVFATGARDGKIIIWDTRTGRSAEQITRPDNCIHNCHPNNKAKTASGSKKSRSLESSSPCSITGLIFQDEHTIISCGAGDGSIKVWDLRKNYSIHKRDPLPKHSIPYCGSTGRSGYTNLTLDKSRVRLFANCMDNVIYCFNVSTYNVIPEQRYVGHENNTFYIKSSLSPDSNYLVSGSSNDKAFIWNVKYSNPIIQLNGHIAEVTCASWCQVGDIKIITCSDDARHKIWRIGREEQDDDYKFDLRGFATEVPPFEDLVVSQWGTSDRTPQSLKRKSSDPHSSSNKKFYSSSNLTSPGTPSSSRKRTKRSLLDMMNGTLPTLKESHENGENEPKRMNLMDSDGAANCSTTGDCVPSTSKYQESSDIPHCSKVTCGNEQTSLQSPERYTNYSIYRTPTKSPRKIVLSPITPTLSFSSPTVNLPNYVLNGEAPHLRLMSPRKRSSKHIDWLTKIAQDKRIKTDVTNQFNNFITESDDPSTRNSPQSSSILTRRASASKRDSDGSNATTGRRKVNTTLLNYFTSANTKDQNR